MINEIIEKIFAKKYIFKCPKCNFVINDFNIKEYENIISVESVVPMRCPKCGTIMDKKDRSIVT